MGINEWMDGWMDEQEERKFNWNKKIRDGKEWIRLKSKGERENKRGIDEKKKKKEEEKIG